MTTTPKSVIKWEPVAPFDSTSVLKNGVFASLDALRQAWVEYLQELPEAERVQLRQRSLRRLSIETGIIERIYDVDWGLTLTLVAEGFSRDVVERAGGAIDTHTLATLVAQRDSLEMVLEVARGERELTPGFIKELHAALTRNQETYDVIDTLGVAGKREMVHGKWKMEPNHVDREDGVRVEYCPPEQVASEIDQLLKFYGELEKSPVHPIVKAAWFHHRFVRIHPFVDGNGRVARALTLLVLEQHRYAPLVVDRFHRADYLEALNAANLGDLVPLTKLFVSLESAALTSELERPETIAPQGLAIDVAHTLAQQLAKLKEAETTARHQALRARAIAVGGMAEHWFKAQSKALKKVFADQKLYDVEVAPGYSGLDSAERAHWFRREIINSARIAGHYANFTTLCAWWSLRIRLKDAGLQLRFVASMHGVGRDVGVAAITCFADLAPYALEAKPPQPEQAEAKSTAHEQADLEEIRTSNDAFRFANTEVLDAIQGRAPELNAFLESGLAIALTTLLKHT
jgi:fido (protein-threonine AMPylation protein)